MTKELTSLQLADGTLLWTVSKVCEHIGVAKTTFTSYVSKRVAPQPAFAIERTRLWDAEEIKAWHATRPGSPVPNAPTAKAQ